LTVKSCDILFDLIRKNEYIKEIALRGLRLRYKDKNKYKILFKDYGVNLIL